MLVTIYFALMAAVLAGVTIRVFFHLRWIHRLPAIEATSADQEIPPPTVSVVLAARDEEARIETTLRRLLAQICTEIEVIVVDDRSIDRTGEIVRKLAQEDARVKFRRVDVLPSGWLGKCHACHVGAREAAGDWILFTDADCWMKPDVVARALAVAQREGVEHVTLTPGVAPETAAARAWHLNFLVSMADWMAGVNRDHPKRYLGIGAFNLMRADAYRQCGGYEALRLTVLDDVRMGLLLRRAGKKTRAFLGGDDVECHWGHTVPAMIKIMEKNYFAALEYRTGAAFMLAALGAGLWSSVIFGLLTGTIAGFLPVLALASWIFSGAALARRLGWSWTSALLVPIIAPALFYAVINSTIVTLRQGGIRWRDTFYPLEQLRAGEVR
jgi:glycosyltransferase involved in cell wall biosynthesis